MMRHALTLGLIWLVAGCGGGGQTPKASLYEDDHVVPAHWPSDLDDLAAKLRQRLATSPMEPQTLPEIIDLVSWTSEVVADTNLSEADWIPIDAAAGSIAANLKDVRGVLPAADRTQLERLCQIVEQASGRVPQVLPPYSGVSQ